MKEFDFRGKTVFVTGAGGFIGSHLVELLLAAGASVRALVRYNSFGSRGWLDRSEVVNAHASQLTVVAGDIRDAKSVEGLVEGTEYGFHLASLIAIPYSYKAPDSYLATNAQGALNVLESCLRQKVRRLIHTSTSEVYGTAVYTPIDEKHPLQAQSPYSATKIAADTLAYSYFCSFGLPVVTVRPFNTFGPRQSPRAVIPTILSQVLFADKNVLELGDLTTVRDFTFATDTARGMMAAALATSEVDGKTINLGTGESVSIGDVAEMSMQACGRRMEIVTKSDRIRPSKSEVFVLQSDNRLAKTLLGWSPQHSFADGLQRTYEWWKANPGVYRWQGYVV